METEQELSYTFAYSQDVLYRIKDWLDTNVSLDAEYVEIVDVNDVRTRGPGETIKKQLIDSSRIVVVVENNLVSMIKRECNEHVYTKTSDQIKRLCKTRVYKTLDGVEIKFEHVYYEHNTGDLLDPLIAAKQITLHNLLQPTNHIDITTNSHLGTDEILANCRLEYEYKGQLSSVCAQKAAQLIDIIETTVVGDVIIQPFVAHTSVFNEICYRTFVDEKVFGETVNDVKLWALKLDGMRGKAYIINGVHMYVQLDDMQMFSGNLFNESEYKSKYFLTKNFEINSHSLFCHNRIVGVQVEYVVASQCFYITDILSVFRYTYNNRNQYDVSAPVTVDLFDAIHFINTQETRVWYFKDNKNDTFYTLCFQKFYTNLSNVNKDMDCHDGYIGVTINEGLIKYKPYKTYEMKYDSSNNKFVCSFGSFVNETEQQFENNCVYEVMIVKEDVVRVIKKRSDRLIYN
ncbi:lef-4 [Psilogramma increta granulovirus]|uniref:Lef-4 n=1 Tax=Psilogramma increta granulovirus TaxID=2953508 RepID=A0A977TNQ2_9BBAC|nr:lef-4 [Psilogramma increta granulovirus]